MVVERGVAGVDLLTTRGVGEIDWIHGPLSGPDGGRMMWRMQGDRIG